MYVFTTQCFASRVGGIEDLVTNFALSLANKYEVTVFADQHLYIQDEIFDLKNEKILKTFRYSGIKFFRRIKKAKDIKLFIKENNINGIIADTWKSLELCIDEINQKKIPVICLIHGNELIYNNEKRKKRIYNTLKKVNKVVANSKYTGELAKKLRINDKYIHIVNPGAKDLRFQEVTNSYNFSGGPILLTVARLDKRKGHQKVLYSLKKLKDDFPQIQYIIAGEGPEKKELFRLAKKLQIQNHVHFVGNIDDRQKKEIFEITSLMVMPTSDETLNRSIEGFGIAYIEAAMFGICSVASDIGGVREAVIHEETGILISADDNLYSYLKDLLYDEKKLKKLSTQAQERALKNFKWDRVVENYLNIFKISSY